MGCTEATHWAAWSWGVQRSTLTWPGHGCYAVTDSELWPLIMSPAGTMTQCSAEKSNLITPGNKCNLSKVVQCLIVIVLITQIEVYDQVLCYRTPSDRSTLGLSRPRTQWIRPRTAGCDIPLWDKVHQVHMSPEVHYTDAGTQLITNTLLPRGIISHCDYGNTNTHIT